MVVPVFVARGRTVLLAELDAELPGTPDWGLEACWMSALRWTLSKEKPPSGALVSMPIDELVNSDMVDVIIARKWVAVDFAAASTCSLRR